MTSRKRDEPSEASRNQMIPRNALNTHNPTMSTQTSTPLHFPHHTHRMRLIVLSFALLISA